MRFSEAKKHKVVSTATAETVGRVERFIIDPATRTVVALHLKKTDTGDTLAWGDMIAFGADAVTVDDADRITGPSETIAALDHKDRHVLGKRLLTTGGDELGKLEDVEFDPESGAVRALIGAAEEIDGARLVGIGSYAVVVSAG